MMKLLLIPLLALFLNQANASKEKLEGGSIVIYSQVNSRCGLRVRLFDEDLQMIGKRLSLFPKSLNQQLYKSTNTNNSLYIRDFLTIEMEFPLLYNPKDCKPLWKKSYTIEWKPNEKQCFTITSNGIQACKQEPKAHLNNKFEGEF